MGRGEGGELADAGVVLGFEEVGDGWEEDGEPEGGEGGLGFGGVDW